MVKFLSDDFDSDKSNEYHLIDGADIAEQRKKGKQSSDTITKNQQYDIYKWRHMLDMGHGMKIVFFQNVLLIMFNNFNHDQLFL